MPSKSGTSRARNLGKLTVVMLLRMRTASASSGSRYFSDLAACRTALTALIP